MGQAAVFTLLFLISANSAFALCKLNQQGHNICTKEKALLIVQKADENRNSINKQYEVVSVKKHIFRERTVIVKSKNFGEKEVLIDDLVGNKLCEDSDTLCSGEKVIIREACADPKLKSQYTIEQRYENNVVELSTGSIFFSKSFLTENNCIDSAK